MGAIRFHSCPDSNLNPYESPQNQCIPSPADVNAKPRPSYPVLRGVGIYVFFCFYLWTFVNPLIAPTDVPRSVSRGVDSPCSENHNWCQATTSDSGQTLFPTYQSDQSDCLTLDVNPCLFLQSFHLVIAMPVYLSTGAYFSECSVSVHGPGRGCPGVRGGGT